MSNEIWPHATPQHPCPICGKPDWCSFGARAMLCRRVESVHSCTSGGWYHFYDDAKPDFLPHLQHHKAPPQIDASVIMEHWRRVEDRAEFDRAVAALGVSYLSMRQLRACWADTKKALAFPMSDAQCDIGIRLRNASGFKWAMPGSHNGVFMPCGFDPVRLLFIPEGPTNTAAFLTMGLYAVGRPNATGGNQYINDAIKLMGCHKAVIVADNDKDTTCAGYQGALKLKKELRVKSCIWIPPSPFKDVRDFMLAGGNAEVIMSDIRGKIWTR